MLRAVERGDAVLRRQQQVAAEELRQQLRAQEARLAAAHGEAVVAERVDRSAKLDQVRFLPGLCKMLVAWCLAVTCVEAVVAMCFERAGPIVCVL